jgi:hypothetical protein
MKLQINSENAPMAELGNITEQMVGEVAIVRLD